MSIHKNEHYGVPKATCMLFSTFFLGHAKSYLHINVGDPCMQVLVIGKGSFKAKHLN